MRWAPACAPLEVSLSIHPFTHLYLSPSPKCQDQSLKISHHPKPRPPRKTTPHWEYLGAPPRLKSALQQASSCGRRQSRKLVARRSSSTSSLRPQHTQHHATCTKYVRGVYTRFFARRVDAESYAPAAASLIISSSRAGGCAPEHASTPLTRKKGTPD